MESQKKSTGKKSSTLEKKIPGVKGLTFNNMDLILGVTFICITVGSRTHTDKRLDIIDIPNNNKYNNNRYNNKML